MGLLTAMAIGGFFYHWRSTGPPPNRRVSNTMKLQKSIFLARGNVVRSVNTHMAQAYWLIGREIVLELQGGKSRAKYGGKVIEELSARLTERFGQGFSSQTLWKFRLFYQAYSDRALILSPPGIELPKGQIAGSEMQQGFSPQLTWLHYRALMRTDVRG